MVDMFFFTFVKDNGWKHYRFNADETRFVKGIYHIEDVNNYHSCFKGCLKPFDGVSLTNLLGIT